MKVLAKYYLEAVLHVELRTDFFVQNVVVIEKVLGFFLFGFF